MYKSILQKAGLSPTQAQILEYLFTVKEDKASEIAKKIKKSRAIVYKDLEEMLGLSLVERFDKPNMVSYFRVGHPAQMEKFFDKKENEIKKDRELFNNYLPDMVSSYNLIHNKPGVKYYEGLDGIIKALESVAGRLTPETEIISFTKVLPERFLDDLNDAVKVFINKRIKKRVRTRVIAFDSPESRQLKENDTANLRETRIMRSVSLPFDFSGGEIFIYGNAIYFLTIENDRFFAFTVENKSLSQMLTALFETVWPLDSPYAAAA